MDDLAAFERNFKRCGHFDLNAVEFLKQNPLFLSTINFERK